MGNSPVYSATDPNGKVIKFRWSGSHPPTDEDVDKIFIEQGNRESGINLERAQGELKRSEETFKQMSHGLDHGVGQWMQRHPGLADALKAIVTPVLPDIQN